EWLGPEDFEALLRDLYSDPGASSANAVQIMTIHRAKGLEFDHVLIPALDRAVGGPERPLLRWIDLPSESGPTDLPGAGATSRSVGPLSLWIDLPSESGPTDLLVAPAPGIGEEEGGELAAYIGRLHARRNAHERTRLMYVAATRARRTLYLSGAPRSRADGSVAPEARTLLGCLWPVLGERFESAKPRASPAGASPPIPPPRAV